MRPSGAPPFDVEAALRDVEALLLQETECDDPLLSRMAKDLIAAGGKRLRPRIALLAYGAAGGTTELLPRAIEAAAAFELVHTATLVHDDIIDQSPLRRGVATLHTRYGIPHAIVAGDYLFTRGFGLSGRQPKHIIDATLEAATRLAEGEVLEQRMLGSEVDLETYLRIIAKKTAEPLRGCGRVGALLVHAPPEIVHALGEYGLALGLAFQIQDDLLDIVGDAKEMGKVAGVDAKAGVLTLPGLLAGVKRGAAGSDAGDVLSALADPKLIEGARQVAFDYSATAKKHLDVLPPSVYRDGLARIADEVVKRRS